MPKSRPDGRTGLFLRSLAMKRGRICCWRLLLCIKSLIEALPSCLRAPDSLCPPEPVRTAPEMLICAGKQENGAVACFPLAATAWKHAWFLAALSGLVSTPDCWCLCVSSRLNVWINLCGLTSIDKHAHTPAFYWNPVYSRRAKSQIVARRASFIVFYGLVASGL